MQFLKQFAYEKRSLVAFLVSIYLTYETVQVSRRFFDGSASGIDLVLVFFLMVFTLLSFCSVFMLSLTPYKRVISKSKTIEDETIYLPRMHSFSESNEISLKIPYNDDKDYMIDFLEKNDEFSMLDLSKFDIKLFTEDDKEIETRLHTYRAGYYGIGIDLKNKADLKYVSKIKIKTPKPIDISVHQTSYNGK